MLTPTTYSVDTSLLQQASDCIPNTGMKNTINQPTGNFFYDPWVLKDEYKDTIWEALYDSLPVVKGEARVIILEPGQCYTSHADIDDRYHLNISGSKSYLVNLETNQMHFLDQNGIWYDMNAGQTHTAANFGRTARAQLVIRKLLLNNYIKDPVPITIHTTLTNLDQARFIFDNTISPWLNTANKKGYIANFSYTNNQATFDIEESMLYVLKNILPEEFTLE
jgi:hypothetical protein